MKLNEMLFFSRTYDFLHVYIPKEKVGSSHTFITYKQGLKTFRQYVNDIACISTNRFGFKDCTYDFLLDYRNYLHDVKNLKERTVNNKLSAIKSYVGYASARDVALQQYMFSIEQVPYYTEPKEHQPIIEDVDALAALLHKTPNTRKGLRDKTILCVLYGSAMRVAELVSLEVRDVFVKAGVPSPVLVHSFSTPSLVAQVMHLKFMMGVPFNRQEQEWFRMGLVLTRADMAYWVIRCSEEWFLSIYQKIHEQLLKSEVLHMDEIRIQCNKEEGRKANTDSFMWVMRSGVSEEVQTADFHYSPSRSTEVAKSLLLDYEGYLITDAYSGYNKAGNYKRCLCWAHCRRYFIESIPLDNKGKEIAGSKGAEGREYINLLFKVETEIEKLSFEEKKKKRQDASKPIFDAFWLWIEKTAAMHTTNENFTI